MNAVKDFIVYEKIDFKNYKKAFAKNPNEVSRTYVKRIMTKYKNFSQEELLNLKCYVEDQIWINEKGKGSLVPLKEMDRNLVKILLSLVGTLVAIYTIMTMIFIATNKTILAVLNDVDSNILECLYNDITALLISIGVVYIVIAIMIIVLSFVDYYYDKNQKYRARFLKDVLEILKKMIVKENS